MKTNRFKIMKAPASWWNYENPPGFWIIFRLPTPRELWTVPGLGRRVAMAPYGTILAATWIEAINYATRGIPPRPIAEVYPEFCGLEPCPTFADLERVMAEVSRKAGR